MFSASMKQRLDGDEDSAKLLKEIESTTPTRGKRIRDAWKSHKQKQIQKQMTTDEALALIISASLSVYQYKLLRKQAIKLNHDIYPSYNTVLASKNNAYPEDILITEERCEVKLQALLNHTAERLFQSVSIESKTGNYILYCKWGFDGSSGFSQYKQTTLGHSDDSSLFVTSMVPIQLKNEINNSIIWQNPACSSTRYCRPIRLQYAKKTTELSQAEEQYITSKICQLRSYVNDKGSVKFSMEFTMIDGKVCSAVTKTSSMMCYICKAKISQMNNLNQMKEAVVDMSTFRYGLSTLHAYIRFFECLLHISYRLDFKQWKVSKKNGTDLLLAARKKNIQNNFREKLGLLVDFPKQGFGSSNDGNTARRFFKNHHISAEITGIDETLIIRFGVILQSLSSGQKINLIKFNDYCWDTANLYVRLYEWYYMPPSVHKILIHGSVIIGSFVIPIGQLSEEAQEARNKDLKRYRENYTRKTSRIDTNTDLFNRLLLSSDPKISGLQEDNRKRRSFSVEVKRLLLDENDSDSDSNADEREEETEEDD